MKGYDRDWAAEGFDPEDAMTTPTPRTDTTDFLKRTNEDYAAWCKAFYQPDALDHRGFADLHGLWAWQEQERRAAAIKADLAAAQEALVEERNVSAWLSSDVTRLGQKLQEAQEARERAEERLANERAVVEKLREDYERAGAKPRFMALMKLIRETQDVNVRAQRAEALAESHKADAERYRWLRDNKHLYLFWSVAETSWDAAAIDADIDAARGKE